MRRLTELPPENCETYLGMRWVLKDYAGRPGVNVWYGKTQSPKRYVFRDEIEFNKWLKAEKAGQDATVAYKSQRKLDKAAGRLKKSEELKIGQILHYSWGYEQTNCEFFQITRKNGMKVWIREIGSRQVDGSDGMMSCKLMPARDKFVGEEIAKVITESGIVMDFGIASPCADDSQHYSSWYG